MGMTNLDALTLDSGLTVGGRLNLGTPASVAAAGSNSQANATALAASLNVVATVSATTRGVRLPSASAGDIVIIHNAAATAVKTYPATGGQIGAASTNAALQVAAGKSTLFMAQSATRWRVLAGA